MRILSKPIRNLQELARNGKSIKHTGHNVMWETNIHSKIVEIENDCMSEPFTKPSLSLVIERMIMLTLGIGSSKKQSITLDTFKHIITDLATQLDRVTTKATFVKTSYLADDKCAFEMRPLNDEQVFGKSQAYNVVDDLSLEDCEVFIVRWSEELKCLRAKYRSHLGKKKFRSLEGLNTRDHRVQKLTEAHKDFHWFIYILKSLPKSSVCQEGCAREELLNLYILWKKGQLISMLPIMDLIMKTLLKEKDSVLKRRLQHRSALIETGVPLEFKLHHLKDLIMKFSL